MAFLNISLPRGYLVKFGFVVFVFLTLNGCVSEKVVRFQSAPSNIPVTHDGFVAYLDSKKDLKPFEGIWEAGSNSTSTRWWITVGIFHDANDQSYPYKAFIIDAYSPSWKANWWSEAGEYKIKFSKLEPQSLAISKFHTSNKKVWDATWETIGTDRLVALSPGRLRNAGAYYSKIYPLSTANKPGSNGSGSGWHVGSGYIITNAHVVDGAKTVDVAIDGRLYPADIVVIDNKLDLAVLDVAEAGNKLGIAPLASSVRAGQRVYAMGFPLGLILGKTPKITDGLISSLEGLGGDPTTLTISAPIQPGSSGGPVFDDNGNVVGVVVSKLKNEASPDGDTENINYAVNVSFLRPLIEPLNIALEAPRGEKYENVCDARCSTVVYIEVNR